MRTPTFVFFDLDDTLLDHRGAERKALRDVHTRLGASVAHIPLETFQDTYNEVNTAVWVRYGAGDISKPRAKMERFENLVDALSLTGAVEAESLASLYLERYSCYWSFMPGAREAYIKISSRIPVGILTNGFAEVQHAKTDCFPILSERARCIVISEEVGFMKPDPKIFAHASMICGHKPGDILYVGDSLRSDILGGLNAGWQVAWFDRLRTGWTGQADKMRNEWLRSDQQTELFTFTDWEKFARRLISTKGNT